MPVYFCRIGDRLTSRPTVEFSKLDGLPLVLFCRPSGWRNRLDEVAAEHSVSLNVALEADSLSMQTNIAASGRFYALLGPYAVAAASKVSRLQSSRIVAPTIYRYVALAMSPRGKSTLACHTVMQVIRETVKAEATSRKSEVGRS